MSVSSESPDGRRFTESWEGINGKPVLVAYRDSAGVPTIGFGHTDGVVIPMTCTAEQADAWMGEDMAQACDEINACLSESIRGMMTQDQYDALADWEFNTGGLSGSRLSRLLLAQRFAEVPGEMARWCHARVDGVETVLNGLVRRRAAEGSLWTRQAMPDGVQVPPIAMGTPSVEEGVVPLPPPASAIKTTTGKLQLGSLLSGGAAAVGAVGAAVNQAQPAVTAVHQVQGLASGLHGPILYAIGGCVVASIGFTVWTLVRKQLNVTGKL